MDFDRDAVLTSFVAETQEGLDLMEQSLLAMESRSGGTELLDDVFRVAHTLKGNATSLELDDLKGFAHAVEDLLDVLREQNAEVSADVISLLLKAVDELRALVAATPREVQRSLRNSSNLESKSAPRLRHDHNE